MVHIIGEFFSYIEPIVADFERQSQEAGSYNSLLSEAEGGMCPDRSRVPQPSAVRRDKRPASTFFHREKNIRRAHVDPCVVPGTIGTRRGTGMPDDVTAIENEHRCVTQAKRQIEEQIVALQQHVHDDEIWLDVNPPATAGYQERWKETCGLAAYIVELTAQAQYLDEVLLDLTLEREHWNNPDLLRAP